MHMNVLEETGHTPLLRLERLSAKLGAHIWLKDETRNPTGSIKDRVACYCVRRAKERGDITGKKAVIEACSGTLGVSLAMTCAVLGYHLYVVMTTDIPRAQLAQIERYGAVMYPVDPGSGMAEAVRKARLENEDNWHSWYFNQFENPDCVELHRMTTGPEIAADMEREGLRIDAFIDAVASGATISGVGAYLKERDSSVFVRAVEPAESPVLSGGSPGRHGIYGVGFGFVPANFHRGVVDDIYRVETGNAIREARRLMRMEGLACGISTGANIAAAMELARRPEFRGKHIIVMGRDAALPFLTTPLFSRD